MANNFASDANCKALWRFENGANLGLDSIGGNHLTNNGAAQVTAAGSFQEGAAAADFESGDPDYMEIADGSLDAGFPLKNGDTNKKISVSFWMKPESIPASTPAYLASKFDATNNKQSFAVALQTTAKLEVYLGYSGGAAAEIVTLTDLTIVAGRWYHVTASYDDATRLCRMIVYGVTEGQWYTKSTIAANALNVEDAAWQLGNRAGGGRPFDGILDEVVVFNTILTFPQVEAIRLGTYPSVAPLPRNPNLATDPHCVALWRLEADALSMDSVGGNLLTNTGVVADTVNFREGAAAGDWERGDSTDVLTILDAALDPGFPFKSGDTGKLMTVCVWLRLESIPTGEQWLFTKVVTPNSFALCLTMHEGQTRFYWRTWEEAAEARYSPYVAPTTLLATGQWYHIGASLNGNDATYKIRVYDLSNDETTEISGTIPASTWVAVTAAPLRIGGYNSNTGIDGLLDEIVVFSRVLSSDEIDAIRGGTFGGSPPEKATTPSPEHEATGVAVDASLSWTDGGDADTFDVYFGTDAEDLALVSAAQAGTSYAPAGDLADLTEYFWRIDSSNAYGTTEGDVWSFTTELRAPEKAINPSPANAGTGVEVAQALGWTDGGRATSYDVYFGESAGSLVLVSAGQAGTSYAPPDDLDAETTYYWRIDSINAAGTTTGDLWSFTTEAAVRVVPLVGEWTWPIRERLVFNTEIHEAQTRAEQRVAKRLGLPRQNFGTKILLRDKRAVRRFEAVLSGLQKSPWPVPVWPMAEPHTSSLPAGSGAIAIDTRYADYRAAGYAMIWQSDTSYEAVTVAAIADDALTLDGTTQAAFTGHKWIMPCRLGWVVNPAELEKLVGDAALADIAWEVVDVAAVTGYAAALEYDDMAVLTTPSYIDGDSARVTSDPDVVVLGGDTGPFTVISNSTHNEVVQPHVWHCRTKQECWELRQFLHAHRGRQKPFLVPTFKGDLELTRPVGAADTSIYVANDGFTRSLDLREYLAFRPAGATIIPRKVTGITVFSDQEEKIDLASAPGAAFAAGKELCWVDKCRMAHDVITLEWSFHGELSCSTQFVRVP
jgi:hypothetical protein